MSTDRHSSSFAASPDETNLFLDIQQEAPLCGHRKRTRIIGSYAILAVGATWILQSLQELIVLLLCSCDVILLAATEDQEEREQEEKKDEKKRECLSLFDQLGMWLERAGDCDTYNWEYMKSNRLLWLQPKVEAYNSSTICYYCIWREEGTAAMLLVMAWKPHISILSISMLLSSNGSYVLAPIGKKWIKIIMLVEAICAGFFMSVYIGYVHQYNSLDSQPDVLNSLYSPLQQSSALEGLRYHDGGRLSDQQMALLQYQRENLHFLSEEILRLQECLSKYERSDDGSTPQVDLAHLLAARDQELRTLSAEMNQLQSELRLARSLIAEGDSEIQRVRTTNNQYVEENERLRAILGEWSTRAAKGYYKAAPSLLWQVKEGALFYA
ncbi:hypothetical protein DH2020_026577 [Rehmannia glutinosa]|uniref:Uncharacterized protein n=1 Tax=Rehmannia glutinosa TaxID=99300 RepID=A0ABR0VYC2_REHGL